MEDALIEGLEEVADDAAREVSEQWRERAMRSLEGYQHASNLTNYFTPVRKEGGEYIWEVRHPTAVQHEKGGSMRTTYGPAQAQGWTRDEYYETLEDCQVIIEPKRYAVNTVHTLRGDLE